MDEEASRVPPFLGYFDVSNSGFAWRVPRSEQIERRRAAMEDLLIFDILLRSGGIRQPTELFPPQNVEDLVRLLNAIDGSHYDTLKKECLVYLLLKWHQDGREEKFQADRCLPPQFTALADAYWHLDAGINVPRAVGILSDARLNRDYASKIIHAISLSPNSSTLIVSYVRTAKPLLVEPVDIDTYTLALAETSFLGAWQFQRTFNEIDPTRSRLLEKILEWSISPEPRSGPLSALLGFSLSPFEEDFIHKYALEPPNTLSTSSISILRDFVCVRLIQSGKYAAAVKIDYQFASSIPNESKTNSQERRKMIRNLYDALPSVERMLLDTELKGLSLMNELPPAKPTLNGLPSSSNQNNIAGDGGKSQSQSWEEIPRQTNGPTAASTFHDIIPTAPIIPISERLGSIRPISTLSTSRVVMAAAPLVHISTPTANGNGNITAPRKSFPLPMSAVFSGSGSKLSDAKPRQSLTQTPAHLLLPSGGGAGSPISGGLKFPFTTANPQPVEPQTLTDMSQAPASRKQNAFYHPQPPKNGHTERRTIDKPMARAEVDMDEGEDQWEAASQVTDAIEDMEVEIDANQRSNTGRERRGLRTEEGKDKGFEFSVFGNNVMVQEPPPRRDEGGGTTKKTRSTTNRGAVPEREKRSRRIPPGAFVDDEEDAAEDGDQDPYVSAPQPLRKARSARQATKPTTQIPKSGSNGRTRFLKDVELGRSLPGTLMPDEDADADEGEEEDHVEPLRSPTLPLHRSTRKGRSSTPSEIGDGDGGEGVQTRRRSSRLSSAHLSSEQAPPPKKREGKGRRNVNTSAKVATSGVKKKR